MDKIDSQSHTFDEVFEIINALIQKKEIFKRFQKLNNESLYHQATLLKEVINGFTKFADMLEQSPSIHLVEQLENQLTQVMDNLSKQVELPLDLLNTEGSRTDTMADELQTISKACKDMQKQLQTVSTEPARGFMMFPPILPSETLTQPPTNSLHTILNAR